MILNFTKMHGLGNDFVIIDAISQPIVLNRSLIRLLSDRHRGIGFDQLLLVELPRGDADFSYRIFNADGNEVEQCGNGARCFARFVYDQGLTTKSVISAETKNRIILMELSDAGLVNVDMGHPVFNPSSLPFICETPDALFHNLDISNFIPAHLRTVIPQYVNLSVVSMGNPHAVIEVKDLSSALVQEIGSLLAAHPSFPESVNVGFMQILSRNSIRLRVFERGVGETQSCGTGACAAAVIGIRCGYLNPIVSVEMMSGESLTIRWTTSEDSVHMIGLATKVFEGSVDLDLF